MRQLVLSFLGVLLLLIASVYGHSSLVSFAQDDTLTEKATGEDVVAASIAKIHRALIFPDDHEFLKRIAYVESQFGLDDATFRPDFYGGIWQLNERRYNETKSQTLDATHQSIGSIFQIDWVSTVWSDLLKPLYSGLATRLYLTSLNRTIPQTIKGQAEFWNLLLNAHDDLNETSFIERVTEMENNTNCNGKMDLLVVLDESGSISLPDFNKALSFVADLFGTYSLENVRQGFMTFSSYSTRVFNIDNSLTATEIKDTVLRVIPNAGGTQTNEAILEAMRMFGEIEERPGVPKIMTLFTDGQSATGVSNAWLAQAANITSFAIGIGGYNIIELVEIANNDTEHVFTLDDFDGLTEFFGRLNSETCSVPQKPGLNETIEEELEEKQWRFYLFDLHENGANVFLNVDEGAVESYYSYTFDKPSSALNDGVILPRTQANFVPPNPSNLLWISVRGLEEKNRFTLYVFSSLVPPTPSTTESIPRTTPAGVSEGPCDNHGKYADDENCQKYYDCDYNETGDLWSTSYECNGNEVWCQEYESCRIPSPECQCEQ